VGEKGNVVAAAQPTAQDTLGGVTTTVTGAAFETATMTGDAVEPARAQYPGLQALSTDGVITYSLIGSGCDLRDEYVATAPLQIPADTPAGEYYVVSINYPKRDWAFCAADCDASYAGITGVVPTVMIEPTV
jgi:hypothetical protein